MVRITNQYKEKAKKLLKEGNKDKIAEMLYNIHIYKKQVMNLAKKINEADERLRTVTETLKKYETQINKIKGKINNN